MKRPTLSRKLVNKGPEFALFGFKGSVSVAKVPNGNFFLGPFPASFMTFL